MDVSSAEETFRSLLRERELTVDNLDAATAGAAMIDFYASHRTNGVELDDGGDMLLFQWGTYDWGEGRYFEYDLTRQFIMGSAGDDDDAFWQLSLTLRYEPSAETDALGSGDRWCERPDDVAGFERFIAGSPATEIARSIDPVARELHLGPAA